MVGNPETTPQLAKHRLSDNVGGVKHILSIPLRALGEERHFALVEMAVPTTGSLVIVFQVQTFGPTHASLRSRTAIMITTSNSSSQQEERDAQSIARCSTAHHGDVRAVPRTNRTFSVARNPIPCASSRTTEQPAGGPWRLSQFSVRAAAPDESTCCATPAGCVPSPVPPPPAENARSN